MDQCLLNCWPKDIIFMKDHMRVCRLHIPLKQSFLGLSKKFRKLHNWTLYGQPFQCHPPQHSSPSSAPYNCVYWIVLELNILKPSAYNEKKTVSSKYIFLHVASCIRVYKRILPQCQKFCFSLATTLFYPYGPWILPCFSHP